MSTKFKPRFSSKKNLNVITIKEFYENYMHLIQLDPIEQRVDVQKIKNERKNQGKESKRQGIIGAIFDGLDFSEIFLYKLSNNDRKIYTLEFPDVESILPHKVCDGGHRARSLRDFKANKFPTHKNSFIGSKYYSELTISERQFFENYELRFVIFESPSPMFLGAQFKQTSQTTPLNHQEVMNARGVSVFVSNPIRSLARELGEGINNTPHEVFRIQSVSKDKTTAVYLSTGPQRLSYDRLVARIFYLVLNGEKPNACDDDQIESMYNDSELSKELVTNATPKVIACLDFILGMAKAKIKDRDWRSKLNIEEWNAIMRLYFSWQERCTFSVKQVNYDDLWQLFSKSYSQFHKNGGRFATDLVQNGKPRWSEFFVRLRTHKNVNLWHDTVDWLEHKYLSYNSLIENKILTLKNAKGPRDFPIEMVLRRWEENGRVDEVDGKPLKFKDAEGGHRIAYSNGGKTVYENLVVISKFHNRKMGSISFDDYKKTLIKEVD